jgi:hypothetical protein
MKTNVCLLRFFATNEKNGKNNFDEFIDPLKNNVRFDLKEKSTF